VHTGEQEQEPRMVDEARVRRFVGAVDFPATGQELAELTQRNGAPDSIVEAVRRLTPAKLFHNDYEVWFDVDRLQGGNPA
jgi:Protein of unknown function (DUF2795)